MDAQQDKVINNNMVRSSHWSVVADIIWIQAALEEQRRYVATAEELAQTYIVFDSQPPEDIFKDSLSGGLNK